MIYQSNQRTGTGAMPSTRKHRNLQASSVKCANASASASAKAKRANEKNTSVEEKCRGRSRVQWSEKHVKEGLVLVQEAQLARLVKTGPITEHYEIDPKPFASGQWAKVYRCRSRTSGILYAAKYSSRVRFNADCSAELRHEIALLSLCSQSPRVVRLHDVYETPKEIILVMEYAPGGDLQTLIDGDLVPLEGDVVHFVRQLVEGLAYLHERNIAHLDIKPQNLVMMGSFPECDVKLCDFEISRVILEGTEVREILGTPDYVAPEILHYEPITLAADMWSLGVTTYVLLTGFSPFGGETDQETFQNISLGEVDFPEELFEDVSTQAKDFVARLLVLDPSARMTAKQCLRHEWLRGAPTQASAHLRRYLSKSREVLLERVVSRENLRRAALLSQTTSQANLSTETQESQDPNQRDQSLQDCLLSQSEVCLSHGLTGSRSSLEGSEGFPSPADSRASLNSSRTSLSCASQSCLLNKEQTQGLLSRAQSRSQANLNYAMNRGLLSRIRSLNRIQSQACLLNGNAAPATSTTIAHPRMTINPVISKSREKLYGLKSLSRSQGVLDIYRSLECLRRRRKTYQRAKTEDVVPFFKQLDASEKIVASSNASIATAFDAVEDRFVPDNKLETSASAVEVGQVLRFNGDEHRRNDENLNILSSRVRVRDTEVEMIRTEKIEKTSESEENLNSFKSVESDTLTEDSDEMPGNPEAEDSRLLAGKRPCQRQHSNASSHSNNSATSDDKEDRSTESEPEEPKYTVAQLVSAFNKHQEVASRTSLKAIMTEKRVNEVTFPTGTKALRLFIPDINITESTIVRRKTSYKPRKNWEELRKKNEKNEGLLKTFDRDSGNEDDDEDDDARDKEKLASIDNLITASPNKEQCTIDDERIASSYDSWPILRANGMDSDTFLVDEAIDEVERSKVDTRIDEKYKQCVRGAKQEVSAETMPIEPERSPSTDRSPVVSSPRQKERLPNYIYSDVACQAKDPSQSANKKQLTNVTSPKVNRRVEKTERQQKSSYSPDCANVNLKDILQRVDSFESNPRENLENLRKRTSIAKIIVNDNLIHENSDDLTGNNNREKNETGSDLSEPTENEDKSKLIVTTSLARSCSLSSDTSCPMPPNVLSDVNVSWEDVQTATPALTTATVSSRTSAEKENTGKVRKRNEPQRTSSEGRSRLGNDERRIWGRVCTGSYTRAMEKFSSKQDSSKKPVHHGNGGPAHNQSEKPRRRSSPAMS